MSKNFTTIIERYPNKAIPEAYLRAVLKARPSAGGYAIQAIENGVPILVVDHMDVGVELEAVQELLSTPEYMASHAILAFHQFEKTGQEDNFQPYPYVVDGDAVDLAFGIEGDFPTMLDGDTHPETKLSKTVIIPNLNKFRKFSAGDLKAFMAELNDPTFKDMIGARIANRGYLCFLPPIGESIWISKEKFGSSFPWGRVSNTHGYVETPATVVVSEKRTGWFSKNKGPVLPVAQEGTSPPAESRPPLGLPDKTGDTRIDNTPPAAPTPAVPPQPEGTVVDLPGGLTGIWKTIPAMSKKDRKAAIRRVTNCGNNLPEGSEEVNWTYLEVQYPGRASSLPELKERLEQEKNKPVADAGTKLSGAPTRGSEIVHEANIMILTVEEKSAAETTLLKMMDRQGKEIPSLLELQKMESKYPKFTGQFGTSITQIGNALPEDVATFFKENGKASFHLYLETRSALREAEAKLVAGTTKAIETHILAHDELKPELKTGTGGSWGNWKKK